MEQLQLEKKNKTIHVHRVGSITAGLTLVVWGLMFILYEFKLIADLAVVINLWPLILIGLGIELLLVNRKSESILYDKGAIFIMIMMSFFSIGMACADTFVRLLSQM